MRACCRAAVFFAFCFLLAFASERYVDSQEQSGKLVKPLVPIRSPACMDGMVVPIETKIDSRGFVTQAQDWKKTKRLLPQELIRQAISYVLSLRFVPLRIAGKITPVRTIVNVPCTR